ncbi:cytochrome P450 [Nocardia sp. 2]|uniref:Cytochrome P450 n=1 Tax=Nocardia acididurans TaxID=2802282 RepID=A0ABS1MEW9_9NOCA|nr:cytochrome P450 [Nocardia acididurans]MBL1078279.1 cytochrome P450 [Nocardia acididurans]
MPAQPVATRPAVDPNATALAAPPPGSGLDPVLGDPGILFVGKGVQFLRGGPQVHTELHRRFGEVSWTRMFGIPVVCVSGPGAAREVLVNKDKAFVSAWRDIIGPWFDGGPLVRDGAEHLRHRRLLQPAYRPEALHGYLPDMVAQAREIVAEWPAAQALPLLPRLRELSAAMTSRTLLGRGYDARARRVVADVETCIRAEGWPLRLPVPGTPWAAAHSARHRLLEYFTDAARRARIEPGSGFLSVLCRAESADGDRFSDTEIAEHMIFTLIAAHDTSVAAATSAAYFLGAHPGWQERARAESLARGEADLTAHTAAGLRVLDRVVRESMRIVPPSPNYARRAVADTAIGNRFVPAGTLVVVNSWATHMIAEHWPDPGRFDPDRFLDPAGSGPRSAWLPFGAGAHKCAGMDFGMLKTLVILDAMLRAQDWRVPDGYRPRWRFTTLPVPADGLPVRLRRRVD